MEGKSKKGLVSRVKVKSLHHGNIIRAKQVACQEVESACAT